MTKKISTGILPSFEEILAMLKKGITQSQIAQKYGVSRQAVNNKLKKEDIKTKKVKE